MEKVIFGKVMGKLDIFKLLEGVRNTASEDFLAIGGFIKDMELVK